MNLIKIEKKYLDEVKNIAYSTYLEEYKNTNGIPMQTKENFCKQIEDTLSKMKGYIYLEQGEVLGYLIYIESGDKMNQTFYTPIWGYGALGVNRENILSRLFQKVAQDVCMDKKVHFVIKLYAHDESIIRLFSFLQFGIICEEGICPTDKNICLKNDTQICELSKQKLEENWSEVWSMVTGIIHHLQESPVFYTGEEFTEQLYKDFFMDLDTHVYAAIKHNAMIGLIETNGEKNVFLGEHINCMNIGEAYVIDEYRGKGVAQELLNYAINDVRAQKINYTWVEHGTANPNARGFWNKYFNTYSYTMIRDIAVRSESYK